VNAQNARAGLRSRRRRASTRSSTSSPDIANSRDRIPASQARRLRLQLLAGQRQPAPVGARRSRSTARPRPPGKTVLDLGQLSAPRKRSGRGRARPACTRRSSAASFSNLRGGGDAVESASVDLHEEGLVEDGFGCRNRGGVAWIDADTIYAARDFGPGTMTRSGYPRGSKRVKRGPGARRRAGGFQVTEETSARGLGDAREGLARRDP